MVTKFTIIHKYTRIMDHFKKFTKIFHSLVKVLDGLLALKRAHWVTRVWTL